MSEGQGPLPCTFQAPNQTTPAPWAIQDPGGRKGGTAWDGDGQMPHPLHKGVCQ